VSSNRIADHRYDSAVALDNIFASNFGVRSELGLFVNGRPVPKLETTKDLVAALKPLIEEEAAGAQQVLAQGVAPDRLYKELIKDGRWGIGEASLTAQREKQSMSSGPRMLGKH
jgi:hypothetical protein